mgnify:CR=1 FL=1
MRFAAASVDIGLPSWYGSTSMGLLCATTVAWMASGNLPHWKPSSNVLIMLCNLNAIFLICMLQKDPSEEAETLKNQLEPDEDSSDQGSHSKSGYRRDNSEPSDDEVARAKKHAQTPDTLLDKHMDNFVAVVWKVQLLLTFLLSGIIFWDSYNEMNLYYVVL